MFGRVRLLVTLRPGRTAVVSGAIASACRKRLEANSSSCADSGGRLPLVVYSFCVALSLTVAGCGCVARETAREQIASLKAQNIEQSEPVMRAAAVRLGAELLPVRAEPLNLLWCPEGLTPDASRAVPQPNIRPGTEDGCITQSSTDSNVFRFRDRRGKSKLGIRAEPQWSAYPRLARRGNVLLRLDAVVSSRPVGKKVKCECEGGPTVRYADPVFAFVLDDASAYELRMVKVNVKEEFIEWECKTVLVRADDVPTVTGAARPCERPLAIR